MVRMYRGCVGMGGLDGVAMARVYVRVWGSPGLERLRETNRCPGQVYQ